MTPRKRLALIQTGGTIAMLPNDTDALGFPDARPAGFIRSQLPEIFEMADLSVFDLFFEDSSNLNPSHWDQLVLALERLWPQFDGFVMLHGTDTMAYTAAALSFAIRSLDKPVILTGSQIPISNIRSDARRNLINAVEVATLGIPEIAICFNDAVYRGNRATKLNIADFNAFAAPNFPPLAEIGIQITLHENRLLKPGGEAVHFQPGFDPNVFVLRVFPGLNPEFLLRSLDGVHGLIIEAFGCGNIPIKGPHSLLPLLEACRGRDIPVVMASQAVYDAVDLTKYESGQEAAKAGVWSASDMTIEAAVTKLMWALRHISGREMQRRYYHSPVAGECRPVV